MNDKHLFFPNDSKNKQKTNKTMRPMIVSNFHPKKKVRFNVSEAEKKNYNKNKSKNEFLGTPHNYYSQNPYPHPPIQDTPYAYNHSNNSQAQYSYPSQNPQVLDMCGPQVCSICNRIEMENGRNATYKGSEELNRYSKPVRPNGISQPQQRSMRASRFLNQRGSSRFNQKQSLFTISEISSTRSYSAISNDSNGEKKRQEEVKEENNVQSMDQMEKTSKENNYITHPNVETYETNNKGILQSKTPLDLVHQQSDDLQETQQIRDPNLSSSSKKSSLPKSQESDKESSDLSSFNSNTSSNKKLKSYKPQTNLRNNPNIAKQIYSKINSQPPPKKSHLEKNYFDNSSASPRGAQFTKDLTPGVMVGEKIAAKYMMELQKAKEAQEKRAGDGKSIKNDKLFHRLNQSHRLLQEKKSNKKIYNINDFRRINLISTEMSSPKNSCPTRLNESKFSTKIPSETNLVLSKSSKTSYSHSPRANENSKLFGKKTESPYYSQEYLDNNTKKLHSFLYEIFSPSKVTPDVNFDSSTGIYIHSFPTSKNKTNIDKSASKNKAIQKVKLKLKPQTPKFTSNERNKERGILRLPSQGKSREKKKENYQHYFETAGAFEREFERNKFKAGNRSFQTLSSSNSSHNSFCTDKLNYSDSKSKKNENNSHVILGESGIFGVLPFKEENSENSEINSKAYNKYNKYLANIMYRGRTQNSTKSNEHQMKMKPRQHIVEKSELKEKKKNEDNFSKLHRAIQIKHYQNNERNEVLTERGGRKIFFQEKDDSNIQPPKSARERKTIAEEMADWKLKILKKMSKVHHH